MRGHLIFTSAPGRYKTLETFGIKYNQQHERHFCAYGFMPD